MKHIFVPSGEIEGWKTWAPLTWRNSVPPSGAFAAFNRYGEAGGSQPRREIHTYAYNGHEGGEAVHVALQMEWLAGVFEGVE